MSALVIVSFNMLDLKKLKQYSAAAGPTVASHGGEFLAKGAFNTLYGKTNFSMTAVIHFSSVEAATNWYNCDDYQQIIPLRNEAMESHFQIVG